MSSAPKILHDGKFKTAFVRAWAQGRGRNKEFMIQVWLDGEPNGEPDGDWAMPGVFGLHASIDQAFLQTTQSRK